MQEKDMVLDALNTTKASLSTYQTAIIESNSEQVRKTFQQMRDGDEKFQFELYKIANKKGYYQTPAPAQQNDVTTAKNTIMNSIN